MAKPYADLFRLGPAHAFLVLDAKGDNIFDSGGPKGTAHAAPCGGGLPVGHARIPR
jgi:hypothetical protein